MTETSTHTAPQNTDTTPSVSHAFCPNCTPNPQLGETITAVCGARRVYIDSSYDADLDCPVCIDLEQTGCPACG